MEKQKIKSNFDIGRMSLFEMKRINVFVVVLLAICFTACKQPVPSGMEKAFGCVVGKTTLEEFCSQYPEDSYEWGFSWSSPRIEYMMQPDIILPGEVTTIRPFRYSMVICNTERRLLPWNRLSAHWAAL